MPRALLLPAVILCLVGCTEPDATDVRATLSDGQVLAGHVRTDTLLLEGELGTLAIPLADVGEVLPVEGSHLGGSGGYVNVWLRNGSEFNGRWAEPELAMELAVGGALVGVDLPVAELTRFQLQGAHAWPDQPVFRVRTHGGDDFLVDPEMSRIAIANELGTFAPFLSECSSIVRVGDQWQVALHTGTVLLGDPVDENLDFDLAMGPESLEVPVAMIASMHWEDWDAPADNFRAPEAAMAPSAGTPVEASPRPRRSVDKGDGWFSNETLYDAKH